ncbi:MAG: sigma-54 dependent transcriptional regulator [Spirochaetaceae bacterium]
MKPNILIIDDNKDILTAIRILLSKDFNVTTECNPKQLPLLLRKNEYNVILLDMNFSEGATHGEEGFKWLKVILDIDPLAVVILITAYGDIELAVQGMKLGATDFILKPWENQKLLSTLFLAADLNLEKRNKRLVEVQNRLVSSAFPEIIGEADVMLELFDLINRVSDTEANILITGENGTGKDLVAKAIHKKSRNSNSIFLGVDMGSIPETLFESEMFGHQKGAFTGADKNRIGRIEAASGGTLFLDEIGNIPMAMQSKLLRVLETREVIPLGSEGKRSFNTRLICATNSNLQLLVTEHKFRQDLLYRINTVEIKLPTLRDRKTDIPILLNHFLESYSKKYGRGDLSFSKSTINKLIDYEWPGNVRELNNYVERAVILSKTNILQMDPPNSGMSVVSTSSLNLESIEQKAIEEAINSTGGNLTKAAEVLGITRATLYRKKEKYDL